VGDRRSEINSCDKRTLSSSPIILRRKRPRRTLPWLNNSSCGCMTGCEDASHSTNALRR
jgi:hypothetical protein